MGRIGEMEISMESGGHAGHDYDVCACARQHVPMLVCMNSILWRAQANISVQSGPIREIKVSMEWGEQAGPVWAHYLIQARKLVCMHTICLRAQVHILAKLGRIR